jgi:hypothetical protein
MIKIDVKVKVIMIKIDIKVKNNIFGIEGVSRKQEKRTTTPLGSHYTGYWQDV